tara:strand:+ start:1330 stop:1500 length:171 start_codon:yes stop_codon:yes gene_type:complete
MSRNFKERDERGRVTYQYSQDEDLIEEWWYSYDDKGKRTTEKYIEELKPIDYIEHI